MFTDGFEFHRGATDEFVFGKAPDVPDLPAGAGGGDMAALHRTLDDRWGTGGLRSRLAEPSLMQLVNYLRAPEPARWKQAVFTALFGLFDRQRMQNEAVLAGFQRATADALPGQVREGLDELPPPIYVAGIGAWAGTVPAPFDLFAAFPKAAVQQGDPDVVAVVVHLHDDQESRQSDGYRRIWNGVLRLFTLLQFLPGAWWTTRTGVGRNVYPEFPPPAESPAARQPASGGSDDDWAGATELAAATRAKKELLVLSFESPSRLL